MLAWLELTVAAGLIGLAVWPFSGFCSGRLMGLDCESQAIFGVNLFGPMGVLALICSIWTLKRRSVLPQYYLVLGVVGILGYWIYHTR